MSALIFTCKASADHAIDCRTLTPDLLQNKSLAEIKASAIGNQTVADIFEVTGDDASQMIFRNTHGQLNHIGYQMKTGTITIEGNAGNYLGAKMQGGVLICKGNAGERIADAMRRGILLVEGDVGEYCASNMQAGTVGILGNTGARLGYGMKRGTLLLAKQPAEQATWLNCGLHTLPFLNILYQSFQQFDTKFAHINQRRVQRLMGDASGMGKAEILIIQN